MAKSIEYFETAKKGALDQFSCFIFEFMLGKRSIFDAFIQIVTEIDVLICLKEISFGGSTKMCRPQISLREPGKKSITRFKNSTLYQLAI